MDGHEIDVEGKPYRLPRSSNFFLNWLQNPRAMGAIVPSGRAVGRLMTREISPASRVLELGAGTGTLTKAILDRGVLPSNLYIVECNPQFGMLLEQRFPLSNVVIGDALRLSELLAGLTAQIDFVVCGLPLLLFNESEQRRVLEGAFSLLGPDGALLQFTYSPFCSVARPVRASLGLKKSLAGIAPINVPPAFVYRLERSR